eukprot:TRINITY_DN457_c0_g2_i2.p1 TRINITY_DN457_c0_g2~~TRINITY_DN457_c0_g2_i2.p1  ORF type:complete len:194 (+),score=43.82 TRINITY_DN457_c0_g2_i2:190-771(+)
MPAGRMTNYSFQKAILPCADAFILVLDTCVSHLTNRWTRVLAECQVPVMCWIERTQEERVIANYKKLKMKYLLRLSCTREKLKNSKETGSNVGGISSDLRGYFPCWPVKDYDTLVSEIKTALGDDTLIFSFDSTGLPHFGREPKEKKDLVPVKELFERTIQECLRIQKERGVNQKVLENKKKNTKIKRLDLDE